MFKFATERSETPKELLARTLGNGETVTGNFEVYFQSDRLSVAEWWFKVITTCGMFLLNKLWKRFMDWLCCRRVKEIHFTRGTMVTTSAGRIISWSHSYDQYPVDPLAPKGTPQATGLPYKIEHSTKIFSARDLKQISLQISSPEMGGGILDICPCLAGVLRCCGLAEFEAGVSLSFLSFNGSAFASDPSGLMTAGTATSFVATLSGIFGGGGAGEARGSDSFTMTIVGANDDICHNPDGKSNPVASIADLQVLQAAFISALRGVQPSFLGEPNPDSAGIFTDSGLVGETLVDLAGLVRVPRECLPLLPGEVVLDSASFVYKLNFYDWLRLWQTAGCAYCFGPNPIRPRRFQRAVLLLTNYRVVSLFIYERAGSVPTHLTNFSFSATSYFPGTVRAGYIVCNGSNLIESSLLCDGGRLTANLFNMSNFCTLPINCCPGSCPVTSLDPKLIAFSRRMQQVGAKAAPLELQVKAFVKEEQLAKIGLLDEGALGAMVGRVADSMSAAVMAIGNDESDRNAFSDFEKSFLPLGPGETLINRFRGSTAILPCCILPTGQYLCTVANKATITCCTCGVRPYISTDSSIVTTNAIYHMAQTRTYPWPCVKSCVPPGNQGFVLAWAPIRAFKGQTLHWMSTGFLPKDEAGIFGGKYRKIPGPSSFDLTIVLDGFCFSYKGKTPDRNYLVDDELKYEQHVLSEIQLTLLDIEAGPVVAQPLDSRMPQKA